MEENPWSGSCLGLSRGASGGAKVALYIINGFSLGWEGAGRGGTTGGV